MLNLYLKNNFSIILYIFFIYLLIDLLIKFKLKNKIIPDTKAIRPSSPTF